MNEDSEARKLHRIPRIEKGPPTAPGAHKSFRDESVGTDCSTALQPLENVQLGVGLPSPFRDAKCDSDFEGPCGPDLIVRMTRVAVTSHPQ
jgi:hypothetical protein